MRLRRLRAALAVLASLSVGAALLDGCHQSVVGTGGAGGAATATSTGTGGTIATSTGTGDTTATSTSGTTGGTGGATTATSSSSGGGGQGGQGGSACAGHCGPAELCDPAHLGFDDNCDGAVDEGCPCQPGQAHWCFKGDPSYRGTPGCFDGTELCSPAGVWGPCLGGVHAAPPDNCFVDDTSGCHAISAAPYTTVDLSAGIGNFGMNAVPGSGTYAVACPEGVSRCPGLTNPFAYTILQSGEYTITYTKSVAGTPSPVSCTFPLIVAGPGLRVELTWEHQAADTGVDLDLHVHQPADTNPWGISPAVEQDCAWGNCTAQDFGPGIMNVPSWFAAPPAMPPTPIDWSAATFCPDPVPLPPLFNAMPLGCHNPRLDSDIITCKYSVTDPTNADFCAPENTNIDFPPEQQWIRVAVHDYSNHDLTYAVHPEVKVFCDGGLAADLGPHGYYAPESPVTFDPSDGAGPGEGNRFWIVADVKLESDPCGRTICTVAPTYADTSMLSPFFALDTAATSAFAPPYPP